MREKRAATDSPIHELLATRWSPYAFQDRPVPEADLRALFEAARWAPSSYNEQPWSYIVATKESPEQFGHLVSCLVEGNQIWAQAAPVLALGIVRLRLARNDQVNRAAVHGLGLAAGNLLVEATARGLFVHQMIGILPDKARELFAIPAGCEAWTGSHRLSGRANTVIGGPSGTRADAAAAEAAESVRVQRHVGQSLATGAQTVTPPPAEQGTLHRAAPAFSE